jgi:hypothetical protein
VTPFDGIVARAGKRISVRYELGCINHNLLPPLDIGSYATSRMLDMEEMVMASEEERNILAQLEYV